MNKEIHNIRKVREFLLNIIKDLSVEQLNKIPPGFNNNIIWNLGHLVAAQQGICYKRLELPTHVSENFYNDFKSGSKPERFFDENEINEIKSLFFSTLDLLENDIQNNIFNNYKSWKSRYDVEISNINEAINFLQFHEGLHFGYIMAMRKLV